MKNKLMYVLISRSTLSFNEPIVFDLFVKVSEKYVRVLKEGETPSAERIDNYLSKKDDVLYIESVMIERFMDAKFSKMFEVITEGPSLDAKLEAFIRCTELCFLDLKLVRINADKLMRMTMMADAAYDLFKNRHLQEIILKKMVNSIKFQSSRRALLGAAMTLTMTLAQGDCGKPAFISLFMGALLRDLSVNLIDDEDPHNLAGGALSREGMMDFFAHPGRVLELLKDYKIIDDIMENIIMQHHEHPMGQGFPKGLKRVETYKPAQYLFLADWMITLMESCRDPEDHLNKDLVASQLPQVLPEEFRQSLPVINKVMQMCIGRVLTDSSLPSKSASGKVI